MTADDTTGQTSADVIAQAAKVPMHRYEALCAVLRDRERELLQLKGPCSLAACRLHYAHVGPCDIPKGSTQFGLTSETLRAIADLCEREDRRAYTAHLLADPADRDYASRRAIDAEIVADGLRDRAEHAEAEVAELEHRLACLLDELTGGRMSKTNYDVPTMVQEVEAYFERTVDDEVTELRATVERVRALSGSLPRRNRSASRVGSGEARPTDADLPL